MKSITIHGLDPDLDEEIRRRAEAQGLSLNKTMKALLREALGLEETRKDRSDEFEDLCGVWSREEAREFEEAVGDLGKVDPRDWT